MPTAPIDDEGNVFFYEDSGKPPSPEASDAAYTTLIIVHGTAFHSSVFLRLVPLAPKYNLRLIMINRRDYPGSSPYSDKDLDNVKDPEDVEGYGAFFKSRASEFARFTEWIISHNDMPKADWDRNTGGVFMMAWSAGNGYAISMLSYVNLLPETTVKNIELYLRGFIVFDAPRWIHGLPPGPITSVDQTFRDETISPKERAMIFSKWVGGYYKHASLTSHNFSDLRTEAVPGTLNTPEAMSKEELDTCTDYDAALRSEMKARTGPIPGYAERIRLAAFDDRLAMFFPRCMIHVIWCEYSPWPMVETVWAFEELKRKYGEKGVKGRKVKISMIPGANHFPHWEEPEMTVAYFAKTMAESV